MLTDPGFYLASIPAVLLYGVAKGGFGGSIAILSVPLMALVMPPVQAAAILLPILVLMDALVVKTYWGVFDRSALKILLPAALLLTGLPLYPTAWTRHHLRGLVTASNSNSNCHAPCPAGYS